MIYFKNNRILKLNNNEYKVKGNHSEYIVRKNNENYTCECPMYRKLGKYKKINNQKCSHVQAVELFEFNVMS